MEMFEAELAARRNAASRQPQTGNPAPKQSAQTVGPIHHAGVDASIPRGDREPGDEAES